jgi:MFS family permease
VNVRTAITAYLPATRTGRILGAGIGVSAVGSGAFLGCSVLYFVGTVGFSAAEVGLALSIAAVCGILSPVPAGRLADRIGPVRLYLILVIARGLVYAGFAFVRHYPAYLALACVATAMDRACSPLQQLVVAQVEGESRRTRALAAINSLRNAGVSTGFLLASLVVGLDAGVAGFRALFLFNACTFFIIAATLRFVDRSGTAKTPPRVVAAGRKPFRDVRYLALAGGNGLMSIYDSVLLVLVPAWIAVSHDLPRVVAPLMLGLNTILAILTQVPAARSAQGRTRSRRVIVVAAALLVFATGTITGAVVIGTPVGLVITLITVAVVGFTLAESFQSVAAYELSFDMADPQRRGQYVSVFHASQYSQQVLGPAVMTAVLLPAGPSWLVLAPCFVIGAAAMWWGSAERATSAGAPALSPTHP